VKISNINNYNNVNFGYDKKLHNKIQADLKKLPDKEWGHSLIKLDKFCNSYEDILRKKEADYESNTQTFKDYLDIFLTLKDAAIGYIATSLGNSEFVDDEAEYYEKDYDKHAKCADDWRIQTANVVDYWSNKVQNVLKDAEKNNPFPSKQELGIQGTETNFDDELDELDELDDDIREAEEGIARLKDKELTLKDKEALSLIEEFKPTQDSPSGFSDVAGMDKLKEELKNGIILAIKDPDTAKKDYYEYGKKFPRGTLLYGPPGCGKTYISQALAQESGVPMYMVDIGKTGSHFVNQTSNNLQKAFDYIISTTEKTKKPCIIFLDEVESLCMKRNEDTFSEDLKQIDTMLKLMDKAKDTNVFIIGATNKPKLVDSAVRRRFNSRVFVDIPDTDARKAMVTKFLSGISKGKELLSNDDNVNSIVKNLDGFSNDSIMKISQNAGLNALKRNRSNITIDDYKQAIKETTEEKPDRYEFMLDETKKFNPIGFNK